jgi:hypothetical protein
MIRAVRQAATATQADTIVEHFLYSDDGRRPPRRAHVTGVNDA